MSISCKRKFVLGLGHHKVEVDEGCSRKIHGGGADRKRIFFFVVGGVI